MPTAASLQDGPKDFHLLVFALCRVFPSHVLPFNQTGLLWPIAYSRRNVISLPRLGYTGPWLPSRAFFLTHCGGSHAVSSPVQTTTCPWVSPEAAPPARVKPSGAADPANSLTAILRTTKLSLSHRFLTSETVWDNKHLLFQTACLIWGLFVMQQYITNTMPTVQSYSEDQK